MRWFTAEAARILSYAQVCHHIGLELEWTPRVVNELADYLSRIVDFNDWLLNPMVLLMLNTIWGPHTVDRFASHYMYNT